MYVVAVRPFYPHAMVMLFCLAEGASHFSRLTYFAVSHHGRACIEKSALGFCLVENLERTMRQSVIHQFLMKC